MIFHMTDTPLNPPSAVAHWLEALPRPVAITGGTGFVGSHLVDTLCAAGIRPRVLVRDPSSPRWIGDRPVEWVPGSLEDVEALETLVKSAATVIHLAGVVTADDAAAFDRGNRDGTARLVQAIRSGAPEARLVHVSSLAAAGPAPTPEGIGPEVDPSPVSDYGRSKLAAEREVTTASDQLWWAIVRPPAIYGPRDTDMYELFKMVNGGWATIPTGEHWLTLAYVADVVRCILAAAVAEFAGQTYHLGEATPYRLETVFGQIAEAGGRHVRIVRVPPAAIDLVARCVVPLRRAGLLRTALTRDKAREARQSYWTAKTGDSLAALAVGEQTQLCSGAEFTWSWYREHGWLK